jgi:3-deoxy-D-arabino-heptulosonate 7-phosphate (DAHP) synthase
LENRRKRAAMRPVAIGDEEEAKINRRHEIKSAEVRVLRTESYVPSTLS